MAQTSKLNNSVAQQQQQVNFAYQSTSVNSYQSWDTEETIIWANTEELPYTFLDILIEKKIDGSSIHM